MANPTDAIVAELEREWPKWQFWVVNRYIGGPVWCARRWGDEDGRNVLNAGSADELTEQLEEASS